jgi:hypothetical protein
MNNERRRFEVGQSWQSWDGFVIIFWTTFIVLIFINLLACTLIYSDKEELENLKKELAETRIEYDTRIKEILLNRYLVPPKESEQ